MPNRLVGTARAELYGMPGEFAELAENFGVDMARYRPVGVRVVFGESVMGSTDAGSVFVVAEDRTSGGVVDVQTEATVLDLLKAVKTLQIELITKGHSHLAAMTERTPLG